MENKERFLYLDNLLMAECHKYENDCATCPYDKECNEYANYIELGAYNSICYRCKKWLGECPGTKCQTWTGCIYREVEK